MGSRVVVGHGLVRSNEQRGFDFEGNGAAGDGVGGDFRMGLYCVAWDFGWGSGGDLTKFKADWICLKKR
jgi:hypothetical protein